MPAQNLTYNTLNLCQQRLLEIEEQVAQGWQIQLPIIAREAFRTARGREQIFEVVLRSPRGLQMVIAVPYEPGVEGFLRIYADNIVEL